MSPINRIDKFDIFDYVNIPYKINNNDNGKNCVELVNLVRTDLNLEPINTFFSIKTRKKEVLQYIKDNNIIINYSPKNLNISLINNPTFFGLGIFYDNKILTTAHDIGSFVFNYPSKKIKLLFFLDL